MKLNRETKIVGATLAGIFAVLTMIAAVPGIFSNVDSASGYRVAGAAGTAGNALCSDGSYYNTPCAVGVGFYQTIQSNGTNQPQELKLNFDSNFTLSDNPGVNNTTVTLANTVPRTCNANGCYQKTNGVYHQWGVTASFDTGPSTVSLPIAMTIESVQVTQCYDSSAGCSGGSTTTRNWQSGNWTASSFDVRNNGAGQARWDAWGH